MQIKEGFSAIQSNDNNNQGRGRGLSDRKNRFEVNIANSMQRMSIHGIVTNVVDRQEEILSRKESNSVDYGRKQSEGFKYLNSNDKRSENIDNEVFDELSGRVLQKPGDFALQRQDSSAISNSIRKSEIKSPRS